jgi:hypothetical protein
MSLLTLFLVSSKWPTGVQEVSDRNCYFIMLQADEYIHYLCSPTGYVGIRGKESLLVGFKPKPMILPLSYRFLALPCMLTVYILWYYSKIPRILPQHQYFVTGSHSHTVMGTLHKTQYEWASRLLICQIENFLWQITVLWASTIIQFGCQYWRSIMAVQYKYEYNKKTSTPILVRVVATSPAGKQRLSTQQQNMLVKQNN